jgi:hypothetical protein
VRNRNNKTKNLLQNKDNHSQYRYSVKKSQMGGNLNNVKNSYYEEDNVEEYNLENSILLSNVPNNDHFRELYFKIDNLTKKIESKPTQNETDFRKINDQRQLELIENWSLVEIDKVKEFNYYKQHLNFSNV